MHRARSIAALLALAVTIAALATSSAAASPATTADVVTVPSAPTNVVAHPISGGAVIELTRPASDGGSTITSFRVTPIRNDVAGSSAVFTAAGTRLVYLAHINGQPHSFRVAARNSAGWGPDSNPTATVTPQAWSPFDSWTHAVDRIHQWMIGRSATAQERSLWVGSLQTGPRTPGDLIVALRKGDIHTGIVDPVIRLYWAYFKRWPEPSGLSYWVGKRRSGTALAKVSDS